MLASFLFSYALKRSKVRRLKNDLWVKFRNEIFKL